MDVTATTSWNPYLDEWRTIFAGEGNVSTVRLMTRLSTPRDTVRARFEREQRRELLTAKYALAVPDERALTMIKSLGSVVEMGAGTGYWACCLERLGVDVVAYDAQEEDWVFGFAPRKLVGEPGDMYVVSDPDAGEPRTWTTVLKGGPADLAKHGDRTLLLVWPPMDSMAADCLGHYPGDHVVYVGEGPGGCTADDRFFELLEAGWEFVEGCPVPQWDRVHDYLSVYRRRR